MAEPAKKSKSKVILIALGVVVVVIIAGLGYLGTVDLPPPKGKVEKPISDDRFPK
jgi:flagellar basal body-associated protein FliL